VMRWPRRCRILSGWCLDRFWGPYVAITFFILPMIGLGILMSGAAGFAPFLGAIACGLGIGAEIDRRARGRRMGILAR